MTAAAALASVEPWHGWPEPPRALPARDAAPLDRVGAYHDALEAVRLLAQRDPARARRLAEGVPEETPGELAGVEAALAAGTAFDALGELDRALRRLDAALEGVHPLGDAPLRLMVLVALGRVLVMRGEEVRASHILLEGVDLAVALGARRQEARLLGNLGFLHGESDGRPYEAYTRRALTIGREIDDSRLVIHSLCNLGGALAQQRRFDEARACYEEGLPLAEAIGWRQSVALFWAGLGGVLARTGELDRGLALYARSTEYFRSVGDAFQVARQRMLAGTHLVAAGRHAEAREALAQSLALCTEASFRNTEWQAQRTLSEALEALGEIPAALAALRASVTLREAHDEARYAERVRLLELHVAAENARRAAAIERQRSAELDRIAHTDPLTGLANRRLLRDFCAAALAGRAELPLTLAIFDVDHFKVVNDTYGHDVGDEVLVALARRLGRSLRANDLLARWGGEEFCLALPGTEDEAAMRAVRRLVGLLTSAPLDTRAGPVRVTVSVGVASRRGGDAGLDALLTRADRALYAAKRAGRDQIVRDGDR